MHDSSVKALAYGCTFGRLRALIFFAMQADRAPAALSNLHPATVPTMDMTIVWPVVTGVCLLLAAFLWFQRAELITSATKQREEVTKLERSNNKLQQQLDTQNRKLSKQTGHQSKKKAKAKSKQSRVEQQQTELQHLRSNLGVAEDKVKKLSRDLDRVRIDREEMRQKLARAAELPEAPKAAKAQTAPTAPADSQAVARSEEAEPPRRSQSAMERDVEHAAEAVKKMEARVKRYKQSLVASESELRALRRRSEHNRRAYIITQLQLDLASDEIYVLTHGEPPPFEQANKRKKRAELRGETEVTESVELLNRDNPIDLTSVGEVSEDEVPDAIIDAPSVANSADAAPAEPPVEQEPVETAVADEPPAPSAAPPTADADDSAAAPKVQEKKPQPKAAGASKTLLKPKASGSLLDQLKGRSVLRKKKVTAPARPTASARPTTPPRPGGE